MSQYTTGEIRPTEREKNMLNIHNLRVSFGQKEVLRGVELSVSEHSVFGFIGRNGAGKTTIMKAVLGLLPPDGGEILVAGERVTYGQTATNRHIGYLPDVPEFYDFMTPREYLEFCGMICGMTKKEIAPRSKELLELVRSGKLYILLGVFVSFGLMNPAIAKLTPWLMEQLAESGLTVGGVEANAAASWTQFFKNIPMALLVFVILYSNSFTKEYRSGTLILALTKGLVRYKVVLAKSVILLALWSAGYWVCFGVTYGGTVLLWNDIYPGLAEAAANWWLFGIWTVCFTVLFSTLMRSNIGVLLGTGGAVLAAYLLQLLPGVSAYSPAALMNGSSEMKAVIVTAFLCVGSIGASIPVINKKKL